MTYGNFSKYGNYSIQGHIKYETLIMRLHFLFLLLIGFSIAKLSAQCPQEPRVILQTQEEIEQFKADYPDCKEYSGDLEIFCFKYDENDPTAVTDLTPLSNLEVIGGKLTIKSDVYHKLKSLRGLQNIRKVTTLWVHYMHHLTNLNELSSLDTVQHAWLMELPRLESITSKETRITGSLLCTDNAELQSTGRLKLAQGIDLTIRDCPEIYNLGSFNDVLEYDKLYLSEVENLTFVNAVRKIEELTLIGNSRVRDLSRFVSLTDLNRLRAENLASLNSLDVLSQFNLQRLSLANCPLTNLEGLNMPSNNRSVSLYNMPNLDDISWLEQFESFGTLYIGVCPLLDNMNSLRNLREVSWLTIDSLNLTSLEGLENIRQITSLRISDCDQIYDFKPLIGIDSLSHLMLSDNELIKSLEGLENLRYVSNELNIISNNNLKNIDELRNLATCPKILLIRTNPLLESIEGLNYCQPIYSTLTIEGNPELDDCSIYPVCRAIAEDAIVSVLLNGDNCSDKDAVYDSCGFPQTFKVFYDNNENGLQDAGEIGVPLGSFSIDTDKEAKINQRGVANFFIGLGATMVEYEVPQDWKVTAGEVTMTIDETTATLDTLYIGIIPENFIDGAQVSYVSTPIICNNEYEIELIIQNLGTTIYDGAFELTGVGEYLSGSIAPDFVDENFISFGITDVVPGSTQALKFHFKSPGVDILDLGTQIDMNLVSTITNQMGTTFFEKNETQDLVFLCSYDPNDKQVTPAGRGEEKYTLFDEGELDYHIRFQNTGNYFAQDIVIRDTMDQNLNMRSFRLIGASHELTQLIIDENRVEFVFNNIFLPDSISNEPESHGFVKYVVSPKPGLEEGTEIENTAHIYFDLNPAIVTNTVFNTMVSEYPTSSTKEQVISSFSLTPNPTGGQFKIVTDILLESDEWRVFNVQGAVVGKGELSKDNSISLELPSGLYFFQLGQEVQKLIIE